MRILKGQAARASTHAAAELEAGRARVLPSEEPEPEKKPETPTGDAQGEQPQGEASQSETPAIDEPKIEKPAKKK